MQQEEKELLLMQLIIADGGVNSFIDAGLSYVDVYKLIQYYKKRKYIMPKDNRLLLTKLWKVRFNEVCQLLNKRGLYKYLSPNIKSRLDSMGLEEIYIPLSIRK